MDCEIYKEKMNALQSQVVELQKERDQVPTPAEAGGWPGCWAEGLRENRRYLPWLILCSSGCDKGWLAKSHRSPRPQWQLVLDSGSLSLIHLRFLSSTCSLCVILPPFVSGTNVCVHPTYWVLLKPCMFT